MDDEMVKIAESTFTRTMRNYSLFATIGVELKKIQNELREITKRASAVEKFIGVPVSQTTASAGGEIQAQPMSSDIKYLTGDELKRIRLKKNLKISQMAELLKVSQRKYADWERGYFLMVPWVQEEVFRISKTHARELQAIFKKEETHSAGSPAKISRSKEKRIPIRIITREDIHKICLGLKISQRQLAERLGIQYWKLTNWMDKQCHPSDDVIKKVVDLLESIKDKFPETLKQSNTSKQAEDPERVKPEEIRAMRDTLHWTRRELAVYLGMNESLIYYWEKGFVKPTPPFMNKLRSLREKIKSREISPEYEGPLATAEEILYLQKKLNWYANWMAIELHIGLDRLRDLYAGRSKISYRDTIKIRTLQKKVAMGEIKPYTEDPKIPGQLIHEICVAYRLTHFELAEKVGCNHNMIYMWISGKRIPCQKFNSRLWELWNNAPKNASDVITADEIYNLRRTWGMNQTQFGQKFGVDAIAVSSWERGIAKPPLRKSDAIRAACQETQHSLTDGAKNDQSRRQGTI